MNRRATDGGDDRSFLSMLAWTVVLALVFSAGLIAGQRMIRRDRVKPLVTVHQHDSVDRSSEAAGDRGEESVSDQFFSFYDRLAGDGEAGDDARERAEAAQPKAAAEKDEKHAKEKNGEENEERTREEKAKAGESPAAAENGGEKQDDEAGTDRAPAKYTLQVSAHSDMKGAKARMKTLRSKGLDPHVVSAEIPGKGTYYRVRLGKFPSMEAARTFKQDVERKRGLKTFVSPL